MQLKLCGKCEIDHDESAALLNPDIYKRIFWNNICRWSWAQRASQPYFKGFETIQNKHLENMFNISRGGCQTGITSPFRCHSSGWYNTQFVYCDRHCLNLMRQLVCSGRLWLESVYYQIYLYLFFKFAHYSDIKGRRLIQDGTVKSMTCLYIWRRTCFYSFWSFSTSWCRPSSVQCSTTSTTEDNWEKEGEREDTVAWKRKSIVSKWQKQCCCFNEGDR